MGCTICVDPQSQPIRNGVLLIDGEKIVAVGERGSIEIPTGASAIDCSETTIVAGFWNCHVHMTERKWSDSQNIPAAELSLQLQDFTSYGFTSIFDLSSLHENTKAIYRRIQSGEVDGPGIFSTGPGIVPVGAVPSDNVAAMMGWMKVPLPESKGPAHAAVVARSLVDAGVDAIKIFASGPPSMPESILSEEAMHAIVETAHSAHKPVFVHPNTDEDLRRAVNARVDVIAHTVPRSQSWKQHFAAMKSLQIALIPTLMLWKHMMRHDRASLRAQILGSAIAQLASFDTAGGSILFGTDHGAVDPDPKDEYLLMEQAGLGFAGILASLTTSPARRFSNSSTAGTISPGEPADIVVLRGDVSRGADIFADVRLTIRAGRIIYGETGE